MKEYRIITEEGNEILRASYNWCERYYDSCNGIYEDEDCEHCIYIEEII